MGLKNMMHIALNRNGKLGLAVIFAAVLITLAACGSDDGGSSSSGDTGFAAGGEAGGPTYRVIDNGRQYTIADIQATGAKTPKQYDVTGLPGAVAAWNALLNQKEYEARFYASHSDAVEMGVSWAESVSGPDARVVGDDVQWLEGASERRQCNRSVAHSGCNYTARYGDFVILGNMVLLCEGKESEEALAVCDTLIDKLG